MKLLAVTVLTSLDASDLSHVGVAEGPVDHTRRLARIAVESGISGLVCSVAEVPRLREEFGPHLTLVTPGIRSAGHRGADDQKRVGTPGDAIRAGASLLVVGRPIRDAQDPALAAQAMLAEMAEALG